MTFWTKRPNERGKWRHEGGWILERRNDPTGWYLYGPCVFGARMGQMVDDSKAEARRFIETLAVDGDPWELPA